MKKQNKTSCTIIFVGLASGKVVKDSFQDDNPGIISEHCMLLMIPNQLISFKVY